MKMLISLGLCLLALTAGGCSKKPTQPPPDDKPPITYPRYMDAAWHPSDTMIIYYTSEPDTTDSMNLYGGLWAIRPDGTNNRPYLTKGINPVYTVASSPDWSSDGNWLVFHTGWETNIYKVKANGDSLTKLTFDGDCICPKWSPDGSMIAFYRIYGSSGLYIMNYDGTNIQRLNPLLFYPNWLPNGDDIIAQGPYNDSNKNVVIYKINIYSLDTLKMFSINCDGLTERDIKYNGSGLVFVRMQSGVLLQIWSIKIDGTDLRQLTGLSDPTIEGGMYPCWSPDGSRIVYSRYGRGGDNNGKLWLMNEDGSNKHQLTP